MTGPGAPPVLTRTALGLAADFSSSGVDIDVMAYPVAGFPGGRKQKMEKKNDGARNASLPPRPLLPLTARLGAGRRSRVRPGSPA